MYLGSIGERTECDDNGNQYSFDHDFRSIDLIRSATVEWIMTD